MSTMTYTMKRKKQAIMAITMPIIFSVSGLVLRRSVVLSALLTLKVSLPGEVVVPGAVTKAPTGFAVIAPVVTPWEAVPPDGLAAAAAAAAIAAATVVLAAAATSLESVVATAVSIVEVAVTDPGSGAVVELVAPDNMVCFSTLKKPAGAMVATNTC